MLDACNTDGPPKSYFWELPPDYATRLLQVRVLVQELSRIHRTLSFSAKLINVNALRIITLTSCLQQLVCFMCCCRRLCVI